MNEWKEPDLLQTTVWCVPGGGVSGSESGTGNNSSTWRQPWAVNRETWPPPDSRPARTSRGTRPSRHHTGRDRHSGEKTLYTDLGRIGTHWACRYLGKATGIEAFTLKVIFQLLKWNLQNYQDGTGWGRVQIRHHSWRHHFGSWQRGSMSQ